MNQKNLTFEESMGRLEQIVRSLEQGNVPLEESLKLFQEGTQLVRSCSQLLDNAQLQIQKVLTRGYALAHTDDGTLLKSVSQVEAGDRIVVDLSDGKLTASVLEKENS